MKYEFKDIKDVDLSKLEDGEPYFVETKSGPTALSGLVIKNNWHLRSITRIMFPCSPIVETDKIREEFMNERVYYRDKLDILNWFLSRLSVSKDEITPNDLLVAENVAYEKGFRACLVSKEVEVSDEGVKIGDDILTKLKENGRTPYFKDKEEEIAYNSGFHKGFECAYKMRHKQGVAPCKEVEEKKWTNKDVHLFLNDYVNQLSNKFIKINKPICSNTICESINAFLLKEYKINFKEWEGK